LLEHESVEQPGETTSAEQNRVGPEVGQADILPTADPDREQRAKADILPAQEMNLRARNDPISIDKERAAVGQTRLIPPTPVGRSAQAQPRPAGRKPAG